MGEMCKIHSDVPYVVRESTSVNGGQRGWGCAVCNMLKLQQAQHALRLAETVLPPNTPYGIVRAVREAQKPVYVDGKPTYYPAPVGSPSRPDNLSLGSPLSDTSQNRGGEP